jgi:hypothetical protein
MFFSSSTMSTVFAVGVPGGAGRGEVTRLR